MTTRFGLAPFGTVGVVPCAMLQGPCGCMTPCCAGRTYAGYAGIGTGCVGIGPWLC